MFPAVYNRRVVLLDIVLHPDAKIGFTSLMLPKEGRGTKLIRAKLENESPDSNRIIQYKGTNQGTAFWFQNCIWQWRLFVFSAGERGAEFVNPQDITCDNGKFTASMRMEESCRQPFVGETGAKEAIYSYGHRKPQPLGKY
jgi:hypothetical protein